MAESTLLVVQVVCSECSRKPQPPQGIVSTWRRPQRSAAVLQGAPGHAGYTPPQSSATPRALHTHSPTTPRQWLQRYGTPWPKPEPLANVG